MKVKSDNKLPLVQRLQGGVLVSYNERELTNKQSSTFYEYDQVKVPENPDKGDIVSAIIRTKYANNDELALLHNGSDTLPHSLELEEFNEFRIEAKAVAGEVLRLL